VESAVGLLAGGSMKKDEAFVELRKQAEKMLEGHGMEGTNPDLARLIQEIEVYQVELELQNEELRLAKRELEASRNEYLSFYDSAPVGFVTLTSKGIVLRFNRAAGEILGSSDQSLAGRGFSRFIHSKDQGLFYACLRKAIDLGGIHTCEVRILEKNSSIRIGISAYSDETGKLAEWRMALFDITERKSAELAVQKAREYAESILSTVREPLVVLDADLRVVSTNRSFLQTFQVSKGETYGRLIYELGNRQWDIPLLRELLEGVLPRNDVFQNFEVSHEFPEIGRRTMLLNARRLYREPDATELILLAIEDITERKQMEDALRKSRDELELRVRERTAELEKANKELRSEIAKRVKFEEALKASSEKLVSQFLQRKYLSRKLVELVEKDRKDIAMTLHDEVGSMLTGAKIELEVIESELAESPAVDKIVKVKESVLEVMDTVRDISSRLRPIALDRFGLLPALTSLTDEVAKRSGIKINVYVPREGMPEGVLPEKELALYRIVQESLTNAVKHAEATEVFISLSSRNGRICLSVEDDGKGFSYEGHDENGLRPGHLGISIMRERVSEFEGEFRVESSPGKGTQVMVELPI
jgi:PAS domain S-box-containing protein